MNNDNPDINKVDNLQDQFDRISASYITVTNDMDKAVTSMNADVHDIQQTLEALRSKVDSLEQDIVYAIQKVVKRQETFEGDMSSLHTWTEDTQQRLDGSVTQISLLSERFDWYPEYYNNTYRYQIGDHIITFKKKLNWFQRFIIKLIFGSCEIR